MWRTRVVRSLLTEDVAGLRREDDGADGDGDEADGSEADRAEATLARARRRAGWVVALDWAAILILLLLHEHATPFLHLGPHERGVFSFAILAVAVHSGYRLGQLEKYRAVTRACRELAERAPED